MGSPERPEFGSPIPLSDIEDVLAWVDTFKLSRPTKKINRDFGDAVLLAEILSVHYPKLVEMHNYPGRNSQAQKLNNWMTLNRKVLKKLKLNLCIRTMEQLSNSIPGAIERVLIMVRDKIKRDEEQSRSENRDQDQNVSSGGSYYEACSEEDNVLVVPVKQRCGGALEMVQKKVVSHEVYLGIREQLRDAREANETLKQKVDHFENLIKVKIERIEELQKQLSRKASRRKETEDQKNTLSLPASLTEPPPSPKIDPKYSVTEISIEKHLEIPDIDTEITDFKDGNNFTLVSIADEEKNYIGRDLSTEDATIGDKESNIDVKERKSDIKIDLKSKIPVLDRSEAKESKFEKPVAGDTNDRAIAKEIEEMWNSKGDDDEMTYYN